MPSENILPSRVTWHIEKGSIFQEERVVAVIEEKLI
jgi:hypothetical protein